MMQQFASEHGDAIAGLVLSASDGKPPLIAPAGLLLARFIRLLRGRITAVRCCTACCLAPSTNRFRRRATEFDWLSRDQAEVDKYVADPLCGFRSQVQIYIDIVGALPDVSSAARQARIPRQLPIYIFRGSRDPVGGNIQQLLAAYRAAGLERVTFKEYADARHETLNETNRDEVTRDLIEWLERVVAGASEKKMRSAK